MKKPSAKSGNASRPAEDDEIWNLAASTIEPLKKRKARYHPAARPTEAAEAITRLSEPPERAKAPKPDKATRVGTIPARPTDARPAPTPADFDRRSARKIRSGQVEIEARIDLHGMRQDEAHAVLRTFLMRAHDRGLRYVLVITGKGRASSAEDDERRERGILKRNVPRWLAEPDLRSIVVSHTDAAIRHGGEGALYIHIRNRLKRGP